MVQRKVPDKLGIPRVDDVNIFKKSSPGSPRSPSSPFRRSITKQPGTPLKQPSLVKAATGAGCSPNYMKATISSEARKERSQVSSSSSVNAQAGSVSGKPMRTLKGTCSLKLARRTLTKTLPSFKQVKKISKVVKICGDVNVRKPTCSSTLKDTKFPDCLELSPGATEGQGTSTMKVCPYTYCSLNGHYHEPLPPLQCFLKAKRRAMKTLPKPVSGSDGTLGKNGNCPDQSPHGGPDDIFIEIYTKSIGHQNDGDTDSGSPCDASRCSETDVSEVLKLENYNDAAEHMIVPGEGAVLEYIDCQSVSARQTVSSYSDIKSVADEKELMSMEEEEDNISEAAAMEWEEGKHTVTSGFENDADGGYWGKCGEDDAKIIFEFLSVKLQSTDEESKDAVNAETDEEFNEYHHKLEDTETNNNISDLEHGGLDCLPDDKSEDQTGMNVELLFPVWVSDSFGSQTGESQDKPRGSDIQNHMKSVACQTDEAIVENKIQTYMKNVACQTDEISQEDGMGKCMDISCQTDEDTDVDDKRNQGDFSCQADQVTEYIEVSHDVADSSCQTKSHNHQLEEKSNESDKFETLAPVHLEESINSNTCTRGPSEDSGRETETMEVDFSVKSENEEANVTVDQGTRNSAMCTSLKIEGASVQELSDECSDRKWAIGCKKAINDSEEDREFNPRDPNFLPLPADPEAEKVDLKHQMMEDKKNAEDWMLDHALQQTITKLGPTRKRKVAQVLHKYFICFSCCTRYF